MRKEFESLIKPKAPTGDGWKDFGPIPHQFTLGYEGRYWFYPEQSLFVMSALEVAHDPGDIEKGPEYHVSVSKRIDGNVVRASSNEAGFVLKAFDLLDADEDNHVPGGKVRNYWKPVAENLIGHICPCKDKEPAMVEDKGDYVWRGITR